MPNPTQHLKATSQANKRAHLDHDAHLNDELDEDEDFEEEDEKPSFLKRWRLYLPFVLLFLAAVGWLISWSIIRSSVSEGLDRWFVSEAQSGRTWTCPKRSVSGFPFRIEVVCTAPDASIKTGLGTFRARLNSLTITSQVYSKGHYIAQAQGPLVVALPQGGTVELNWRTGEFSLEESKGTLTQFSSVLSDVALRFMPARTSAPIVVTADQSALHVRPHPQLFQAQNAFQVAYSATNIANTTLNNAIGGHEGIALSLDATVIQALSLFDRAFPENVDAWRYLGGKLMVSSLQMSKGARQMIARGEIKLDAMNRPEGRVDLSASGIDQLISTISGNNPQAGALVASGLSLLTRNADSSVNNASSSLKSLPPLRFEKGRLLLGPIPLIIMQPLF